MPAPLIVTAWIREADLEPFHRLRERFYPRNRNFLSAHVTLFHQLPGDQRQEVFDVVESAVRSFGESRDLAAVPYTAQGLLRDEVEGGERLLPVRLTGLFNMGRGVGYTLSAHDLQELRRPIAEAFRGRLSAQDAAAWRNPHITVQNKVSPEQASRLARHLRHRFAPCTIGVRGLQVWRYEQGPWTLLAKFGFGGETRFEAVVRSSGAFRALTGASEAR